jgi:hypothetical protein
VREWVRDWVREWVREWEQDENGKRMRVRRGENVIVIVIVE